MRVYGLHAENWTVRPLKNDCTHYIFDFDMLCQNIAMIIEIARKINSEAKCTCLLNFLNCGDQCFQKDSPVFGGKKKSFTDFLKLNSGTVDFL